MSASDEYPELYQLFGGWFNQDWTLDIEEGGDWPDAVDLFVDDQGVEQAGRARQELDRLLATDADDDRLWQVLDALGSYYRPEAGGTRAWLVAVRDRLAAAITTATDTE